MIVRDVVEGHLNEAANRNALLSDTRMKICKECPLYKSTTFGPICNNRLYMDSKGNTSESPLDGYKKGCGCRLSAKTRLERATCTHGRW